MFPEYLQTSLWGLLYLVTNTICFTVKDIFKIKKKNQFLLLSQLREQVS